MASLIGTRLALLRPELLSYKNRLSERGEGGRRITLEHVVFILSLGVLLGLYWTMRAILERLAALPEFSVVVPIALIHVGYFLFFFVLVISSFIGAMGNFFEAKDLPVLIAAPISSPKLYAARFLSTLVRSSWMFGLFLLPACFAYRVVFDLPWSFVGVNLLAAVPLLGISTALGTMMAILFVNLIPLARATDVLAVVGFVSVLLILILQQQIPDRDEQRTLRTLATSIVDVGEPMPAWMPPRWSGELVEHYIFKNEKPLWPPFTLLFSGAVAMVSLGYLCFERLFWRGWNRSAERARKIRIHGSPFVRSLLRMLLPLPQQLRALFLKEVRIFLRDIVQALQFLFILTVTCLYIYNFRALRYVASWGEESHRWLHVVLCVVNLCFGASIIAAVATRFVFPSLSLEGRAYLLVRSAPLTIGRYLRYKFLVWCVPLTAIALVLVLSGGMALFATPPLLFFSALLAVPLAVSTVALGVGIGAVYVRFDWDSPMQVVSNFGSLVHMLLSFAVIAATAIPAGYLFMVLGVPNFSRTMTPFEFSASITCAVGLAWYINFAVARSALRAGVQSLEDLER